MTFKDWFEKEFKFPYDPRIEAFKNIFNLDKVEGMRVGYEVAQEQGICIHDGQKLLCEYILNNDKGISDNTRQILELFVGK